MQKHVFYTIIFLKNMEPSVDVIVVIDILPWSNLEINESKQNMTVEMHLMRFLLLVIYFPSFLSIDKGP